METVPLAPAERVIDDDTINGKGPTDDEWKIVQAESNETANDTIETSKVMVAERAVQGSKRHILDSDFGRENTTSTGRNPPCSKFGFW